MTRNHASLIHGFVPARSASSAAVVVDVPNSASRPES